MWVFIPSVLKNAKWSSGSEELFSVIAGEWGILLSHYLIYRHSIYKIIYFLCTHNDKYELWVRHWKLCVYRKLMQMSPSQSSL